MRAYQNAKLANFCDVAKLFAAEALKNGKTGQKRRSSGRGLPGYMTKELRHISAGAVYVK